MEELTTDILVIGSGLAGILSALEAERTGLQVLLTGKFTIALGTNTSMANGAFTAANSRFSEEDHLRLTLEAGKGLNRIDRVETLVRNARDAIERLREYDVPIVEGTIGYWIDRPSTCSQLPGVLLVKALAERLKSSTIRLLPGFVVFELIVEEGEVRGAMGFLKEEKPLLIRSKAVVLATGGAGAIYARNDNQRSILGDGYALALRAGLPLFDLEFVQFFPLVLAEPNLSTFMLFPPYPEEAKLVNHKREDLLERLAIGRNLSQAIITQRDRFSIALYESSEKEDIYLDLTRVPEEKWEHYPLNLLRKSKFPFRERPFLVLPAVHFFMGGVETDDEGRTSLEGLFAVGEVTWGAHGANRLGGNALTECAVMGMRTGRAAAHDARLKGLGKVPVSKWEKRVRDHLKRKAGGLDSSRDLLRKLKSLAWRTVGPIRDERTMTEGLSELASLEERIATLRPTTIPELLRKRELENVALLLRALLMGSLARTESRGSFYRRDFPHQDDTHWLKTTCYRLKEGELLVTHRPVNERAEGLKFGPP